jgi:hypothetical protein
MNRSVLMSALLVALLSACDRGADAGETRTAEPSRTAVARGTNSGDADLDEITDYRLTMDAVQRYYQAQRNVYGAMRKNPELAQQMRSGDSDEPSLDEMGARYEEVPEVRDAIEAAGLDTRDFSVITWALFQSAFAQGAVEMGAPRDSILASTGIHPANLDFVRENKAALERMQQETAALAPPDAADDEGGDNEDLN